MSNKTKLNVVGIIQARMGSSRLPGKVLMDIEGDYILARVFNRTSRANTINTTVIATSTNKVDDPINQLAIKRGWDCFRGDEKDVLDRYYQAARKYKSDVIVRITSDCPLIDPDIIDLVVGKFLISTEADYVGNTRFQPRTFPVGLDVDVIGFKALERAWIEDKNESWREHVAPYIYRNPDKFNVQEISNSKDLSFMRWAIDKEEDLEFVRLIYSQFSNDEFTWCDVISLLEKNPEWLKINQHVEQLHGWEV